MTNSADKPVCPTCHSEMLSKDNELFCPACLLKQGMKESSMGSHPATQNWTPPAIEQLTDRFPNLEIEALLGQGGMGAVYKVRQKELDRPAALKVLPEAVSSDPSFTERFLREARLLASLSHPHIVTVYEFGQRDGLYFILMEFVDGVTLRQASMAEPIKRLAPREGLAVVGQLCDALQFAHDEGVVHRDIKPENILIDKRGRVKIADFGLAKLLGKPADLPTLTRTHQLMGTPAYMAPEQVEGQPIIDHRADIYSLGVVFYELLTGELPLGRFQPPSAKAELDARLDEVVFRTLEKEPDRRYQQASQLRTDMDAIRSAGDGTSATALQPKSEHQTWHWGRLLGILWAFIAVSLALFKVDRMSVVQRVAIAVAAAAIVGLIIEGLRPQSKIWTTRWSRWAAGVFAGLLLPLACLWALENQIEHATQRQQGLQSANARLAAAAARERQLHLAIAEASVKPSDHSHMYDGGAEGYEGVGGGGRNAMGNRDEGFGMVSMMGGGSAYGEEGGDYEESLDKEGMYGGDGGTLGFSDFGGASPFGGPPQRTSPPGIKLTNSNASLTGMPRLTGEKRDAVNAILTDIRQKYLKLESDHTIVREYHGGVVKAMVYDFPEAWHQLEDELWTRLDDAVDVQEQRIFRRFLPLTNRRPTSRATDFDEYGYPESPDLAFPGLMGWASLAIRHDSYAASVNIGRKGRWYEWFLTGFDSSESGPELPDALRRFNHKPGPWTAINNARNAFIAEEWASLNDSFTHAGRLDFVMAFSRTLPHENLSDDAMAAFSKAYAEVHELELIQRLLKPAEGELESMNLVNSWERQTDGIYKTLSSIPDLNERQRKRNSLASVLPTKASSYQFIQLVACLHIGGDDEIPRFILAQDFEFSPNDPVGDTAAGTLVFADGIEVPVQLVRVANKLSIDWKIDAILTAETSLLVGPDTPASEKSARAENDGKGANVEVEETTDNAGSENPPAAVVEDHDASAIGSEPDEVNNSAELFDSADGGDPPGEGR